MCGISGIIYRDNRNPNPQEIRMINDLITHRGPDDEGFFLGPHFALGLRRLAILDLSQDGHQPMWRRDEFCIVFNGEIYNYIEIKAELSRDGYSFQTGTDTEVILAAYDRWGSDCVSRFNGMWSFAIYDRGKQVIFCSRDRFGVKPFYYTFANDRFIFGSEIKQLLPFLTSVKANLPILMNYLACAMEDYNTETFFQDVHKLDASHSLFYDLKTHTMEIRPYFRLSLDPGVGELSELESCRLFRTEFERSVSLRLRSDVKVGVALSGGLDSSTISAIASKIYREESGLQLSAITILSADPRNNEESYARQMVERCGLDWHPLRADFQSYGNYIEQSIATMEEPFVSPSVLMQHMVYQKAREAGCIVMLGGQGGDETLLGYDRYFPTYLMHLPLRNKLSGFRDSLRSSQLSALQLLGYCGYFLSGSIRLKHVQKKCGFIRDQYLDLLDKDLLMTLAANNRNIVSLQIQELTSTQLPHLLKYEDKNSMRNSVESRLPFLDYQLVQTVLSINNKFKIKDGWTKSFLRKGCEDILPAEVAWRIRKIGFEGPESEWLRDTNAIHAAVRESRILGEITDKIQDPIPDPLLLWRLYNIARWEAVFHVRS